MEISNNANIYIGCGITKIVSLKEWEESVNKSKQ
jgi:hypothetical protein